MRAPLWAGGDRRGDSSGGIACPTEGGGGGADLAAGVVVDLGPVPGVCCEKREGEAVAAVMLGEEMVASSADEGAGRHSRASQYRCG